MSLKSIDPGIRELLRDPVRRHEFFKALTQDDVAEQIRALRKRRDLTQKEFAALSGMKQSAVSRIEQAEYSSWSFTILMRVAKALNARWRMVLEPCEDAVKEFEPLENIAGDYASGNVRRIDFADKAATGAPADIRTYDHDFIVDDVDGYAQVDAVLMRAATNPSTAERNYRAPSAAAVGQELPA